jgi:4-hydroxybenzoate polyprenyltransferase
MDEVATSTLDRVKAHIGLCRFDHWIKNVFVLPGWVIAWAISPDRDIGTSLLKLALGMLSVGLIASSNYVLNEILDAPSDRIHPTKKSRPIPAGRASVPVAYAQWILLAVFGMLVSEQLPPGFRLSVFALWVMGCLYNIPPIRTKDVPYLDVLSESVNNPLRMLIGWYVINPAPYQPSLTLLISYWMIGCYFMALKRFAEYRDIGSKSIAAQYRKSFAFYNDERLLNSVMFYASSAMIFLGAFVMRYRMELILSFPCIAWVMAVYLRLAFKPESAVQAPEKLYREPVLMTSVLACSAIMGFLLFHDLPWITSLFSPTLPVGLFQH